ncbi:MAG: DEAD/DEAH box helicase, partial [Propionibacteriaceae bacterium]|nr:DEAD/DEAH box helicase [Propionibacteriaceae bacterium]
MSSSPPSLTERLLEAAAGRLGGTARDGQRRMAAAVAEAVATGGRLLVQAGTGTGKSLAYLAPAAAHLVERPGSRAVVATATLALQTQLATKDIPTVVAATAAVAGRDLAWSLLKGRSNYACLLRVRDGAGPGQAELVAAPDLAALRGGADEASALGAEVVALRQWAEDELAADLPGDRDTAPEHSAKAWSQVAVAARECVGVQACPYAGECFAEAARDRARLSDLVVTNH